MIKAVAFDLDGTLIDSTDANLEAYEQIVQHWNLAPLSVAEFRKEYESYASVFEQTLEKDQARIARELWEENFSKLKGMIRVYGGAASMLKRLGSQCKLALVTQATNEDMKEDLPRYGLAGIFDVLVTREKALKLKPDPQALLEACRELAIQPQELLYVGDDVNDAKMAANAGSLFAGAGWGENGYRLAQAGIKRVARDFSELETIIHTLRSK
ncbi:HAD family hydrolase [Candidatus Micrarchaeota archaeon]|nr:HAD family hydrolase [Candidatus Micrarchaeota archaeon]